jgi:carboxypeptidase PM20D1
MKKLLVPILIALVAFGYEYFNQNSRLVSNQAQDGTLRFINLLVSKDSCKESNGLQCTAFRLSNAIKIKTVTSRNHSDATLKPFLEFHAYLEQTFPLIHEFYNRTLVNTGSLVYQRSTKDQWLFYGHIDVVQANETDAFSGEIKNGFIIGRGTLDMKGHIISFLSAMEGILKHCKSNRDTACSRASKWTIALGHDEESGGLQGAKEMSRFLKDITFNGLLDEGMPVLHNIIPLVGNLIVLPIGITERGYLNVKLSVKSNGGHSSIPLWRENPVRILSSHLESLMNVNVFTLHADFGPTNDFVRQLFFRNRVTSWLYDYSPVQYTVSYLLSLIPTLKPLFRTTMAVTYFVAGSTGAENVVPSEGTALINIRIHPNETIDSVKQDLVNYFKNEKISLEFDKEGNEPCPVTNYKSTESDFHRISKVLRSIYGEDKVIVVPALVIGGTDSRHFWPLVKNNNVYRVSPFKLQSKSDISMIHGPRERISLDNLSNMLRFYEEFI